MTSSLLSYSFALSDLHFEQFLFFYSIVPRCNRLCRICQPAKPSAQKICEKRVWIYPDGCRWVITLFFEHRLDHFCRECSCIFFFSLFSGESGLGKSTLINSLFLTDLYPERYIPGAAGTLPNTRAHTCMHIHTCAHCNNRESSAAMSPTEHYFKRNVGNALVSKYDPALFMPWLMLGLMLAWAQLLRLSLVSLCR